MQTTAKHLNAILYRPGEGGNFLTRLFALSDNTQFLWVRGTCDCKPKDHSISEKLKYYWYFPEKITRWLRDAHLTPYGLYLCHNSYDYWETNPIIISCSHYSHAHIQPGSVPNHIAQKYFFVKTTDELFQRLKENVNMQVPEDSKAENALKEDILKNREYDYIDMDLLIDGDTFENEYRRVCQSMGLEPIDIELARSFLINWKEQRVDKPRQL